MNNINKAGNVLLLATLRRLGRSTMPFSSTPHLSTHRPGERFRTSMKSFPPQLFGCSCRICWELTSCATPPRGHGVWRPRPLANPWGLESSSIVVRLLPLVKTWAQPLIDFCFHGALEKQRLGDCFLRTCQPFLRSLTRIQTHSDRGLRLRLGACLLQRRNQTFGLRAVKTTALRVDEGPLNICCHRARDNSSLKTHLPRGMTLRGLTMAQRTTHHNLPHCAKATNKWLEKKWLEPKWFEPKWFEPSQAPQPIHCCSFSQSTPVPLCLSAAFNCPCFKDF